MTFDKFEPFQGLKIQNLRFVSNRYEVWQSGAKIKDKIQGTTLRLLSKEIKGEEKALLYIDEIQSFENEITQNAVVFDIFITATDRLQLWNVPSSGNGDKMMAITMMKQVIGNTRGYYDFSLNEPYVCNIFLVKERIAKVSFSFVNPDKQVEFYDDVIMKDVVKEKSEVQKQLEKLAKELGL